MADPKMSRGFIPAPTSKTKTDFFTYTATYASGITVVGGATPTATTNIVIQNDADFEVQKLTATAFVSLGSTPTQNDMQAFTVLLTDTGSGRQLMDAPVLVRSLFGSAELPFILPQTKILASRTTLAVTVANLSSSIAYAYIQLAFVGRKVFNYQQ